MAELGIGVNESYCILSVTHSELQSSQFLTNGLVVDQKREEGGCQKGKPTVQHHVTLRTARHAMCVCVGTLLERDREE